MSLQGDAMQAQQLAGQLQQALESAASLRRQYDEFALAVFASAPAGQKQRGPHIAEALDGFRRLLDAVRHDPTFAQNPISLTNEVRDRQMPIVSP